MVVEMYDTTMVYSMGHYNHGADGPFNFNLIYVTNDSDALDIYRLVNSWLTQMPTGKWPHWVVGIICTILRCYCEFILHMKKCVVFLVNFIKIHNCLLLLKVIER